MSRLFLALALPEEIKALLATLVEELPRARWAPRAQLHLTLRFLGELDPAVEERLGEALRAVHAPALLLSLAGVGVFPPRGPARVLWAGLAPPAPLAALAQAVEQAVCAAGAAPADRPFAPHVTLARLRDPPPHRVRRFLERHRALSSAPFPVASFGLYSSRLSPRGAEHRLELELPLA